jgi:hypothetical protein
MFESRFGRVNRKTHISNELACYLFVALHTNRNDPKNLNKSISEKSVLIYFSCIFKITNGCGLLNDSNTLRVHRKLAHTRTIKRGFIEKYSPVPCRLTSPVVRDPRQLFVLTIVNANYHCNSDAIIIYQDDFLNAELFN